MSRDIRILNQKDFSGGLNLRADAFELASNESPDLLNVDVDPRGGVQMRQGVQSLTQTVANPNILTANEASIETSTAGWAVNANCTLSRVTTQHAFGAASLAVTCSIAGTTTVNVGLRSGALIPIAASTEYTAFIFSKAASVARNIAIRIYYYDVALVAISNSASSPAANNTTDWASFSHTSTSPSNAVYALVGVETASVALAEIHYIDGAQLAVGKNTNGWLDPAAVTTKLPGYVQYMQQFENSISTIKQLIVWTERDPSAPPTTSGQAYLEGLLWVATYGSSNYSCIGAFRKPRMVAFKDKLYVVGGNDNLGRIGFSWNGTTATAMGVAFNDNLVVPTGGNVPSAKLITSHMGSVWLAGTYESSVAYPNRVRWSHPNFPEDYRTADYIDIDTGADGDYITALVPFRDRLLVFKRHSIHAIVGTDPDTFAVYPVSREIGALNQDAVCTTDTGVYMFTWPQGVFHYDGSKFTWLFSKLAPLVDSGQLPDQAAQLYTTLAWSGRRLWVAVPYRATTAVAVPTENTAVLVLDPALSKEGSWVMYDVTLGPMLLWRPSTSATYFLGSRPSTGRIVYLEGHGDSVATDNYGSGAVHISSHYRTRWMDLGQPAVKKQWRAPDFVLRSVNAVTEIGVEVFHNYDPTVTRRDFTLTTVADDVMEWGDAWGGVWGGRSDALSVRSEICKGASLGTARAVQLLVTGPTTNHAWGLNQIAAKYTPRQIRS